MEKERQFQLFRAMIKEAMREKGINLASNLGRECAGEVQKLNARYKIEPPLKVTELLEVYLEIGKELAEEHFSGVASKLTDEIAKEKTRKS